MNDPDTITGAKTDKCFLASCILIGDKNWNVPYLSWPPSSFLRKNIFACGNWLRLYFLGGREESQGHCYHPILNSRFMLTDLFCGIVVAMVKLLSESLMLPPSLSVSPSFPFPTKMSPISVFDLPLKMEKKYHQRKNFQFCSKFLGKMSHARCHIQQLLELLLSIHKT